MSFINNVAPNLGGAPASVALATSVAQAMGAAGSSPTARLLLPQAVTAPVVIPSYADTPRLPNKVPERLVTTQPVSSFAAQVLAQEEAGTATISVLTPRPQTAHTPANPQAASHQPVHAEPYQPAVTQQATATTAAAQSSPAASVASANLQAVATSAPAATATPTEKPVKQESRATQSESLKPRERSAESRGAAAYFVTHQRMHDRRNVPVEAVA